MVLLLKNERIKRYDQLATVMACLHAVVFTVMAFSVDNRYLMLIAFISLAVVAAALTLKSAFPSAKRITQPFSLMYGWLLIAWILLDYFWVAPLILLIGALHLIAGKQLKAIFSSENIIYPSIPPRTISWSELSNVVLKDSLLTIDFKNNKLIQAELDPTCIADEAAFNVFVRQQIRMDNFIIDNG